MTSPIPCAAASRVNSSVSGHLERLWSLCRTSALAPLILKGRSLLPVVQGGMGVGVSAGGLAGAVARLGSLGTISSVDLRRLHSDLMAQTGHLAKEPDAAERINAANVEALRREIRRARSISGGSGAIAVNVMKALSQYEAYVRCALEEGADAVVVGAGLPLDLPDLAKDHPAAALIPILSDARGVQLLVRKWEKKGRLPDAIVIEHPRLAGGHLGAARMADLRDPRFDFENAIPAAREFFRSAGIEREIPLIAAGGISCREDIQRLQALGAAGVQLGTAFAVTEECDAAPEFKRILAEAKPEDVVEFVSVAGLPARGVRTPWLEKYIRIESKLKAAAHVKKQCNMAFDCLAHCGLRDGVAAMGQFCIDQQLGHAYAGHTDKGLFFRGAGSLPFGSRIATVQELMVWLLGAMTPAAIFPEFTT
ncbi:MAG: nitronate monooxygenase family protein [Ottowia sp.]|uniref:NAD(P)H-dependent flavin oxidoreductase n=1 Tax=unclassified Ottowia TaxID=2645081 RepID=UPI003C2D6837